MDIATITSARIANHSGAASDQQLLDVWLSRYSNAHTRKAYARDAGIFLADLDTRRISLRAMTVRDLQTWIDSLDGSPYTIGRRAAAAKSLLSFGKETGFLAFDAGAALRLPKAVQDPLARSMTREDVDRMIDAASDRDRLLIRTMFGSGARASELASMRWKDLNDGTITIIGKGSKLRRTPIPESVAGDLEAVRGDDADPIFPSRSGVALSYAGLWRRIKVIAARAGLPDVTPHRFRHSHAASAIRGGATILQVQRSLGHASPNTTTQYIAPSADDGAAWSLGDV
jgi:integrase/recombinase XerD